MRLPFYWTGTDAQDRNAPELEKKLENMGYKIVGKKKIDSPSKPDQAEIRYFFDLDKEKASRIAEFV